MGMIIIEEAIVLTSFCFYIILVDPGFIAGNDSTDKHLFSNFNFTQNYHG